MVDNKTISPRIVLRLIEKRQDKTVKSDASKKNVTERKCVQSVSLHKEGGIIYIRHFRLMANRYLLLRLPVGYGGVLNSPRFCFFSRVESRATAHG